MYNLIQDIKNIILENNFFNTLAGERFKELYDIKNVEAVISFSGRSKKHESYKLNIDSDSDLIYVTHLYINQSGQVMVQLGVKDTDEFIALLHPSEESIEGFDEDIIKEWVSLLTL